MKILPVLVLVAISGGIAFPDSSNEIGKIDFRNFAFRPSCMHLADSSEEVDRWQLNGTGNSITVTNGFFQSNNPEDPLDVRIIEITYGVINSNEVAIVTMVCNTGGSGNFSEGFIFSLANGQPKLLAVISGGDRANGGIQAATIEHGLLRVEKYGTNGGACCPQWVEIRNYKLRDRRLIQVGMERRRKYASAR